MKFTNGMFNYFNQKTTDNIDLYLDQLRQLAKRSTFCGCMADTLLLDRIGMGTTEEAPKKLLQIRDLTLDKCIDVIRNSKTTASRLKMMSEARYEEIKGKKSCKQDKRNPDCTDESQRKQLCIFCDPGHFSGRSVLLRENVLSVTNTIMFLNACQLK